MIIYIIKIIYTVYDKNVCCVVMLAAYYHHKGG